jgi:hypothetical protein
MDIKLKDGDGTWIDPGAAAEFDGDSDVLLQSAWDTLRHGTMNELTKVTRAILQQLCRDTQMLPEPRYMTKKKHLLKKLEQYVSVVIQLDELTSLLLLGQRSELGWPLPRSSNNDPNTTTSRKGKRDIVDAEELAAAEDIFRTKPDKAVKRTFRHAVLVAMCAARFKVGISELEPSTKQTLADSLVQWVSLATDYVIRL